MKKKYLSDVYQQRIKEILINEGFEDNQIKAMLGQYHLYDDSDKESLLKKYDYNLPLYMECLQENPSALYKEEEKTNPILKRGTPNFIKALKRANITPTQAKGIYKYSGIGYSTILNLKRNPAKTSDYRKSLIDSTLKNIDAQYNGKLDENQKQGARKILASYNPLKNSSVIKILEDFDNLQLFDCIEIILQFTEDLRKYYTYRALIAPVDLALKNKLQENMILYRGVESKYIDYTIKKDDPFSSSIGKRFSENGYLSTSMIFSASFATRRNFYGLRLIVPKGTQGLNITGFSANKNELEVLLNSCDLYFIDEYGDADGYPIVSALVLSKDRSCYNDISEKIDYTENE